MLFLDTCTAEAFNSPIAYYVLQGQDFSVSNTVYFDMNMDSTASGTITGYMSNGNGSITGTISAVSTGCSGSAHVKIPIELHGYSAHMTNELINNLYYAVSVTPTFSSSMRIINGSADDSQVTNVCLTDYQGNLIFVNGQSNNSTNNNFYRGSYLNVLNQSLYTAQFKMYLEFDCSIRGINYPPTASSFGQLGSVSYSLSGNWEIFGLSDSAQESMKTYTSDTGTQQAIISGNEIAQQELDTAEDTNTKITDFFGSFFDNLLHIFVPEDGYFSTWFDKVNTLLSDKLGMLYAPFDLVISTLQAIYSSSTTESGIPFPGIKWEDTWLVEPFTFTFASLGTDFNDLRDKVYFATDTVLVLTFLMLLQSKVKLILEGHE